MSMVSPPAVVMMLFVPWTATTTYGRTVAVRPSDNAARVIVEVRDTGKGIAPGDIDKIFVAFYTTKGERGTGLGLWVTRGIVEEQGGSLQLRSSTAGPRHGTTIRITLPVRPAE